MSSTVSLLSTSLNWQFATKRNCNTSGATSAHAARILKDILKGTGIWTNSSGNTITPTGIWSVRYSCDKITAGTVGDLTDRWTDDTKLNWANDGTAHSWIVLRNSALGGVELCMDLTNSTTTNMTVVISPSAGFTGGTTLTRPTATDQIILASTSTWGMDNAPAVINAMISTTGETRILISTGVTALGRLVGLWGIERLTEAPGNIAGPIAGYVVSLNTGIIASTLTSITRNTHIKESTVCTSVFSGPGAGSISGLITSGGSEVPNDYDGYDQVYSVGLYSQTYGGRGHAGIFKDLWWPNSDVPGPFGQSFPNNFSRHWIQAGPLLFPWNTKPIINW